MRCIVVGCTAVAAANSNYCPQHYSARTGVNSEATGTRKKTWFSVKKKVAKKK